MKTTLSINLLLGFIVLLLVPGTAWGEYGDISRIRTTIEKSRLSAEKKNTLLTKVSEAINNGIPSSDAAIIVERGLLKGMESRHLEDAFDSLITANQRNLPVRPVLDRIEQGLSKGVPPERISSATKQLLLKLSDGDRIVASLTKSGLKTDKGEKADSVHSVARALERSIPEDFITRVGNRVIKQGSTFSRFAGAVDSMTSFVEMGMTADQASKIVAKAVDRGYNEKDLFMMQKEMSDMMRKGTDMREIMNSMEIRTNMQGGGSGMGSGSMMQNAPGMGSHHPSGGMGGHRH